jgi:hypothetical protein
MNYLKPIFKPTLFFYLYLTLLSSLARSAPFEIKVHDDLITEQNQSGFEMETHLFQPNLAQGIGSNVFQTRLEYAYGVLKNNEIGVNVFLSNYNGTTNVNGGKIGHMYIPTHEESGIWHYGVKNEIIYLKEINGEDTVLYELTPILAIQLNKFRLTLNPSIEIHTSKGNELTFAPSGKIAYAINPITSVGFEYYSEMINVDNVFPVAQRSNTAYLVIDTEFNHSHIGFGLGKGVNESSDNWVIKLIGSISLD